MTAARVTTAAASQGHYYGCAKSHTWPHHSSTQLSTSANHLDEDVKDVPDELLGMTARLTLTPAATASATAANVPATATATAAAKTALLTLLVCSRGAPQKLTESQLETES